MKNNSFIQITNEDIYEKLIAVEKLVTKNCIRIQNHEKNLDFCFYSIAGIASILIGFGAYSLV